MPNARARWATIVPTRPSPTIPRVLPCSSTPWNRSLSHLPERRAASARGTFRAEARMSASVCSAAERMFDWGALTTITPRRVAASTSTLSRPMPALAITFRFEPASMTLASTFVWDRTTSASKEGIASASPPEARSVRTSTWCSSRRRSRPRSASGSVTRTRIGSAAAGEGLLGRGHAGAPLDGIPHVAQRELERRQASDDVEAVVVAQVADAEHLSLQRSLAGSQDDPVVATDPGHQLVAVDPLRSSDGGDGPGPL